MYPSGTDSPQAVRKLMSLSEPGKTRPARANKYSTSSLHSPPNSPGGSSRRQQLKQNKQDQQQQQQQQQQQRERSNSDAAAAGKISLTAESSSVTSLPALRKTATGER